MNHLLDKFAGKRVLVVGDVMLDRYWWGTVTRVSPEAPVPVVSHETTSFAAGGAANVAANVAGLGARPFLVGITGDDEEAGSLPNVLRESGIADFDLITVKGRKTTVKTRIVAHNQQIARLDQECIDDITDGDVAVVLEKLSTHIAEADVILVSDYGKGFLTRELLAGLIRNARDLGKPVLVDPKGKDYSKYAGASILTPNLKETADACNLEPHQNGLVEAARAKLLEGLGLDALVITEGERGMTVLQNGGQPERLNATARNVYDVTGAGDTAIAALAVALGSGMALLDAARLANIAAGLVVERVGTTPLQPSDLATIETEFKES